MSEQRSCWTEITSMLTAKEVTLGRYVGYLFHNTPRRALFTMSYYKFAAKMIGNGKKVLDVGCSEGLGTWLLAKECGFAHGVDSDEDAVSIAKANWEGAQISFACDDFLKHPGGQLPGEPWDGVVNFDVIEHIFPEHVDTFFQKTTENLAHDGITIVGTPNLQGQQYATEVARAGHVNVYNASRLEEELKRYFRHVFLFAANDEVVHTGYMPMAHYLIGVGCGKKCSANPKHKVVS